MAGEKGAMKWLETMSFYLKQSREKLEKCCSLLEEAILKAEKKHKEAIAVKEASVKSDAQNHPEPVDLTEIDRLLAKARTVRVDVEKTNKEAPLEKKTEFKDPSKRKIAPSKSARAAHLSVHSTKERTLQSQREKPVRLQRPISSAVRKPTNQPTRKGARDARDIKEVRPKVDSIPDKQSNLSIAASSSKGECQSEEKPTETSTTTEMDRFNGQLLGKLNKVTELKRKMLQSKLNHSKEARVSMSNFIADAETFFTDKTEISPIDERCISEATMDTSTLDKDECFRNFGLRIRNKLVKNEGSVTREVISSLQVENSLQSFKELQSLVAMILDYEQVKMEIKLKELIISLSQNIFQSSDMSKSEKLVAYRRIYCILFEDGDRLPTLVSDTESTEESQEFGDSDN